MKTVLYNTTTNERYGPVRNGRYMVDGKPGELPDYLIELEIIKRPDPEYSYETQTLEYREYADVENKLWVQESYVRDLTESEIEQRKPLPPQTCTPRQFRLALINAGVNLDTVETLIDSIEDQTEKQIVRIHWEYSLEIERQHPMAVALMTTLGFTEEQMDELFVYANTI
jgi:hypothetical protein